MFTNNELRRKAEEILKQSEGPNDSLGQMDVVKLVEELSIYQIELEHQNNELRESQERLLQVKERYADLFNFAPVGYIILDKYFIIKEINNTACNILNADSSNLKDSSLLPLIQPECQDTFHLSFKFTTKTSKTNSCDIKMRKPGGRSFYARLIIATDKYVKEGSTLFRIAMMDISIEKELEQKLLIETENAKKSDRLKSVFLANMGHEIRTPLNGILGFSSLMIDGESDTDLIKKYSEIINKNGVRLLQMISNILDISQIDSGNLPIKIEAFVPEVLLENVIELFSGKAKNHNNQIIRRFDSNNQQYTVHSDPGKITQVLMNLLSNAIKFTKDGKIEIGFQLSEGQIIFTVQDNGIGIPDNAKDFLFDRFYQADNAIAGSDEGTGLGLAISKSIVDLLEGTIWYKSELNKGSEFSFSIPVKR